MGFFFRDDRPLVNGHPETGAQRRERQRRAEEAKWEAKWSLAHPPLQAVVKEGRRKARLARWHEPNKQRAYRDREEALMLFGIFTLIGLPFAVGTLCLED